MSKVKLQGKVHSKNRDAKKKSESKGLKTRAERFVSEKTEDKFRFLYDDNRILRKYGDADAPYLKENELLIVNNDESLSIVYVRPTDGFTSVSLPINRAIDYAKRLTEVNATDIISHYNANWSTYVERINQGLPAIAEQQEAASAEKGKFCGNCGSEVTTKFCPNCGTKQ